METKNKLQNPSNGSDLFISSPISAIHERNHKLLHFKILVRCMEDTIFSHEKL